MSKRLLSLVALIFAGSLCGGGILKKPLTSSAKQLPIVFHKNYDISFFGIEKLHPFDTGKYGKIAKYLQKHCNISFYEPLQISDHELQKVHTKEYLASLHQSCAIARISEVFPLQYVPNFLLQRYLLNAMRYATHGTTVGANLALQHGWAINLSGGYHHAKSDCGGGFCFFADIPLAIKNVREQYPDLKILVVDLDAHQGNGIETALKDDPQSFVFDVYVERNYPYDTQARKHITFNYPIPAGMNDRQYHELIRSTLPKAIEQVKPHLIIYNAGTDVFEKDPLGRTALSKEGIMQRDAFVFSQAKQNNIPILMVLSGGYTQESADITAHSIENILKTILHVVD